MDTYEGYKDFVEAYGSIKDLLKSGKMRGQCGNAYLKSLEPNEKYYNRCRLRGLPRIICTKRTHLIQICLADNSLGRLPPEISLCERLESLDLDNNCLTKLPSEFKKLELLTALKLSYNLLEEFPMEILSLTRLRFLTLSHNKFKHIPPTISGLVRLEALCIQDTPRKACRKVLFPLEDFNFFRQEIAITYLLLKNKKNGWQRHFQLAITPKA